MAVSSYRFTQYVIECDCCGVDECCPDNKTENVHTKAQAIKWAKMHKTKEGKILCDKCFKEYKTMEREQ